MLERDKTTALSPHPSRLVRHLMPKQSHLFFRRSGDDVCLRIAPSALATLRNASWLYCQKLCFGAGPLRRFLPPKRLGITSFPLLGAWEPTAVNCLQPRLHSIRLHPRVGTSVTLLGAVRCGREGGIEVLLSDQISDSSSSAICPYREDELATGGSSLADIPAEGRRYNLDSRWL